MSAEIRRLHLAVPLPHAPMHGRLAGLGSVFGKSLRDNRVGMVLVAALLSVMTLAGGYNMSNAYGTVATRADLAAMSASMPPIIRGLYGNPVGVGTIGGFVAWHYAAYFALLVGLWSILALSSTLASEARRGTLEFVLATHHTRRGVALEKVAGHAVALAAVVGTLAVAAWMAGAVFAKFDGDAIAPDVAVSFAIGVGLRGLIAGSVAFALAPLVGRGAAAGIAGAAMVACYVVNSYRTVVPAFDSLASLSWFSWTAGHNPLAGLEDWPALALVAIVCVTLLAVGVEAFARRDVGAVVRLPAVRLPARLLGVHGPFGRSLGDLLPATLAWGLGLGIYGVMMAASARPVTEALAASPAIVKAMEGLLPGLDITTASGYLQLAFVDLGFVLIGLVAATLVGYRSSDETAGRLELQLATPLSRARWALASGAAVGRGDRDRDRDPGYRDRRGGGLGRRRSGGAGDRHDRPRRLRGGARRRGGRAGRRLSRIGRRTRRRRPRDRDLPSRPPRTRAGPPRMDRRPRPDIAPRAADGRDLGRAGAGRVRRAGDRRARHGSLGDVSA